MTASPPSLTAGLGRDASFVFGAQLAAITLGFVLNATAARALSPSDFAALSWSLTWLAWLALCAQLGMMQAATVLLAEHGAGGLRTLFRPIVTTILTNSVVVAVVWWVAVGPVVAGASEGSAAYRAMVALVAAWVPVAAMVPVVGGMLRGLHRFRAAALYSEYVRRAILLGVLIVMVIGSADREAVTLVSSALAVDTAIAVAVLVLLDRDSSRAPRGPRPSVRLRRRALDFLLPTIDAPLLPQAGVWLLALVRPPEEVAVLTVAIGISFVFGLPVFVGARVLGPRYTRQHTTAGTLAELEPLARRHATVSTAFVAAGLVGLAALGPWLVELVFGARYRDAAWAALLIGLGGLVNAVTGSCAAALMHCGHERVVGVTAALGAAVYLGGGAVAGHWWGANGVAAMAAVVVAVRNVGLAVVAHRRLGIRTWAGLPSTVSTWPR